MTTIDIANKYVELAKNHQHDVIISTLFSSDVVSVEAAAPPGKSAEIKGIEAVREKGKQWIADHEIHSAKVGGPWPHGDKFIVRFTYDVTNKPSGQRMMMDEAALFTIEQGKIVREEFFYAMG